LVPTLALMPTGPNAGDPAREVAVAKPIDGDEATTYNYRNFDSWVAAGGDLADEAAFAASPSAGQPAPDFKLAQLGDGAQVSLSALWRSKPLVMEFGSFT
jgi:hypothetical protein